MRAGDLRTRLTLERRAPIDNPDGEPVATWTTWTTVWAHIEPLDGRRRFVGARLQAEVNTRITIRYRAGVDPVTVRGLVGIQVYDFEAAIDPDLAHRELRIDAVARS